MKTRRTQANGEVGNRPYVHAGHRMRSGVSATEEARIRAETLQIQIVYDACTRWLKARGLDDEPTANYAVAGSFYDPL